MDDEQGQRMMVTIALGLLIGTVMVALILLGAASAAVRLV